MNASATPQAGVREAQAFERAGDLDRAIAAYERVLARWPALPDCWYNLGLLQRKTRRYEAALASYQQALDRGVAQPEQVHLNRGVIYADCLREDAAAERELAAALACNPAYVPALMNLANLHEDHGRRAQAAASYERILALDPACFEALARYAHVQSGTAGAGPLIERLRAAVAHPAATAAERASLGFALGRLLDASARYPAAFEAYVGANAASRASAAPGPARYDRAAQERLVDQLIAAFPAPTPGPAAAPGTPTPIFICGMFRSGSTLLERLLAGHPQVTAGGELDLLPHAAMVELAPFPASLLNVTPQRLAAVARAYRAGLAQRLPGATLVTDKRPDNFLYVGLIRWLFPDAKIVHTTRAPLDNCLSIYALHLDHRLAYALDLMDIGHYYRQYRRLMGHWQAAGSADLLEISYDRLVREPRATMQGLLDFLGLEWDARCLEPGAAAGAVKTASVWQVREPLYRHASGRAHHYAEQLAGLRDYLGELP